MATHDYVIDNQSAPAFRSDLNNALQAIVTQNSNATAPTTTYANMVWYDTAANQLKKRNEANSAWIVLGTIDEALGTFTPSGGGTIASQAEAEAGTNNTNLMTPLRAAQAIAALSGFQNMTIGTTSSSFTVPSNVTRLFVMAFGGGGGGGGSRSADYKGGDGGTGGVAASILTVNPGDVFSYTVGAGGVGTNATAGVGTSGGTTSVGAISCTGGAGGAAGTSGANGANGANGTGSGGNVTGPIAVYQTGNFLGLLSISGLSALNPLWDIWYQTQTRPRTASSTSAVAYSVSGSFLPGANGSGELTTVSVDATGGVGGAVIFVY